MIRRHTRRGKDADDRFAKPPWSNDSPAWQEIDAHLPADHLAREVDQAVGQLDLSVLFASYDWRGSRAHRPDLLLKMILYETQCGKPSPAEWHRDLRENDAVKWLVFGIQTSRATLYEFRDRLICFWDQWNQEVLHMAQELGLPVGVRGALDGSSVAALASRHKLVNQKTLRGRMAELNRAIETDQQDHADAEVPAWMAKHADTRLQQRERYQQAQARMDQLQAENQKRPSCKRKRPEKIMLSPSEPEAAVGRDKFKVFRPLYNVQLIYDLDSPFITAYDVFPWQNDVATLEPMLERATEMTGRKPDQLLADSAYTGGLDLAVCQQHDVTLYAPVQENDYSKTKRSGKRPRQIPKKEFTWLAEEETYRCPEGHLLRCGGTKSVHQFGGRSTFEMLYRSRPEYCLACPRKPSCTGDRGRTIRRLEHENLIEQLRQRMETSEAKELYKLRRQTVELRFADMKQHRNLRCFTGRGLRRAKAQIAATVLANNVLALLRTEVPEKTAPALAGIPKKIPP